MYLSKRAKLIDLHGGLLKEVKDNKSAIGTKITGQMFDERLEGLSAIYSSYPDVEGTLTGYFAVEPKRNRLKLQISYKDKKSSFGQLPAPTYVPFVNLKIDVPITWSEEPELSKQASQNLNWIKPKFNDIEAKIQDAFLKEGISFDAIPNSFNNGKLIPLDRKIWSKLIIGNLNVDKWDEIDTFVKKYNKLPAPTVLELNNHSIILISGDLQLAYARANNIKPSVYWIKETEIFKSPHSLD